MFAKYLNITIAILFVRSSLHEYRLIYPKTLNVYALSKPCDEELKQNPQDLRKVQILQDYLAREAA
jgi:hypothetical protein